MTTERVPLQTKWDHLAFEQQYFPEELSQQAAALRTLHKIPKKPPHKHERIELTPDVKLRLRKIIRRLQSLRWYLHERRGYKRQARQRKLQRRAEIIQKLKQAEKKKAGEKGGKGKGKEAAAPATPKGKAPTVSLALPPKPRRRFRRWREGRYRKWRRINYRSEFVKQEYERMAFRKAHPATRPFLSRSFYIPPGEHKTLNYMHVSSTGGNFQPSPGQTVEKPLGPREAKRRLTNLYRTQWEIENYDRLNQNRLVKAMAKLIILAKEKYDADRNRNSVDKSSVKPTQRTASAHPILSKFGTASSEQAEREAEIQEILRKQLQEKVREFLHNDPTERYRILQKKLLPRLHHNGEIRKNTFINRPKTFYDSYLRREFQNRKVAQYLEQHHLLGSGDNIEAPVRRRTALPYRRVLIGFVKPPKVILPGARRFSSLDRRGPRPLKALSRILPHQHVHPKRPGHKRERLTKLRDPHRPVKEKPKVPKEKKDDKGKGKPKAAAGKSKPKDKGKSAGKGPPKDPEKFRRYHRRQKRQRRKKKLRKWITDIEKRRRVKVAQEILDERNFKGPKPNLRGMREKIRELEIQNDRATQLIEYLTRRNEYLHEQHSDAYTKKHSEYFAVFSDWRSHNDEWFHLKDQIDTLKTAIQTESTSYTDRCRNIIAETEQLDHLLNKEISNLEIDYLEIVQFLQQEPDWEEQIAHLETRPLYYEFLYTFREAAEEQNSAYISDLLQRKMHKDFINMALLERRRMRKLLPEACKRVLEERGLLAQEQNKMRIWCNRLQRRREKVLFPLLKSKYEQFRCIQMEKLHAVKKRQVDLVKISKLKRQLRILKPMRSNSVNRLCKGSEKNLEDLRIELHNEKRRLHDVSSEFETEWKNLEGLRALHTRLKHKRCGLTKLIIETAGHLKDAFGIPKNFYDTRWPSTKNASHDMDTVLNVAFEKLQRNQILDRHEKEETDSRFFVSSLAGMSQSVKSFSIKAFDSAPKQPTR